MILVTACGATAPAATQASVEAAQPGAESGSNGNISKVDITLADNTIESSLTTFQVGVLYTFVIANTGRHPHNFDVNAPVSVTGSWEAPLKSALLAVPQEQLSPARA